jgi:hypothetical protein
MRDQAAVGNSSPARIAETANPQGVHVVIDAKLLQALLSDVRNAADRFASAINDPRNTPADVDREQQRAELTIRTHIARTKEFSSSSLPREELEQLAVSFRCEA